MNKLTEELDEQFARDLERAFGGFPPQTPTVPDFLKRHTPPSENQARAFPALPEEPEHIKYKFREDAIINEAFEYINQTYREHYADEKTGIQTMDFIMSNSESYDFLKGNVLKYVARYGKKEGCNKKDIYKAIHYLILLYHFSQDD